MSSIEYLFRFFHGLTGRVWTQRQSHWAPSLSQRKSREPLSTSSNTGPSIIIITSQIHWNIFCFWWKNEIYCFYLWICRSNEKVVFSVKSNELLFSPGSVEVTIVGGNFKSGYVWKYNVQFRRYQGNFIWFFNPILYIWSRDFAVLMIS